MAIASKVPINNRLSQLAATHPYLLFFLFSGCLFVPAFLITPAGLDLLEQSVWLRMFAEQFWRGDIYPRWLTEIYAGRGAPIFFYYPPLPYFITSFLMFLRPLSLHTPAEYYPLAASAWLAVFLSGCIFYHWVRDETGNRQAAFFSALFYMATPTHIGESFYMAMLFGTIWAYAWVPLMLLAAKKLMQGGAPAMIFYAGSLFLLIVTNAPMLVICGPLGVLYALLYLDRSRRFSQMLRLGIGVTLGFGLATGYLLPAAAYLPFFISDVFWSAPDTDFHNFFLNMDFASMFRASYTTLWWGTFLGVVAYLFKTSPWPKQVVFFAFACLGALFMTQYASVKLWEAIPLLKTLQYPTRFFCVTSVGLAAIAGYMFPRRRYVLYTLITLSFVATCLSMSVKSKRPFYFDSLNELNIPQHSVYLTSKNLIDLYYSTEGLKYVRAHREPLEILSGRAKTDIKEWSHRRFLFHYKADKDTRFLVRQFMYPGFIALNNGALANIVREPDTGQMLIAVPAGEGDIEIRRERLLPECAGIAVSWISAMLCAMILLVYGGRGAAARRRAQAIPSS
jgi:hypothetical protein